MASKAHSTSLLLAINLLLLFITLSSCSLFPRPPPTPKTPTTPSVPTTSPSPPPSSQQANCSIDSLKLGVCADVLNLVNATVTVGSASTTQCCSLIHGLVDLEAAVCLCTAIKADVLGIVAIDIQHSLSVILNKCGKNNPAGFQCI